MLFHVVGIVFGFVPGVSLLYNQCLLQSKGEEKGPLVTPRLLSHSATAVCREHCWFFLGFLPFTTKNTFSVKTDSCGALGHLSLAELTQLALGRFGSQKYKPANSH